MIADVADAVSSAPLAPFSVDVRHVDSTGYVGVVGELDILTAPELQRALDQVIERGVYRVVLVCAALGFLPSSGIAIVARLDQLAKARGFHAAFLRGKPRVQRILEMAGPTESIVWLESPEDAEAQRSRSQRSASGDVASSRTGPQLVGLVPAEPYRGPLRSGSAVIPPVVVCASVPESVPVPSGQGSSV